MDTDQEDEVASNIRFYSDETSRCLSRMHERQLARLLADASLAEKQRAEESAVAAETAESLRRRARQREASIEQLLNAAKLGADALSLARQKSTGLARSLAALRAEREGVEHQIMALTAWDPVESGDSMEAALTAAARRRETLQRQVDQLESERDADDRAEVRSQSELDSQLLKLECAQKKVAQLESDLADCEDIALRSATSATAAHEAAKAELLLTLRALRSRRGRVLGDVEDNDDSDELSVSFRDFIAARREFAALREENQSLRTRTASAAASAVSLRRLRRD